MSITLSTETWLQLKLSWKELSKSVSKLIKSQLVDGIGINIDNDINKHLKSIDNILATPINNTNDINIKTNISKPDITRISSNEFDNLMNIIDYESKEEQQDESFTKLTEKQKQFIKKPVM